MSLLERIERPEETEGAEPVDHVVRIGGDRGLSLLEKVALRAHRLSWRTPLHRLRLRGRVPLKLVAVPKDPVAGDKAAGEALIRGRFAFAGRELRADQADFCAPNLPADFGEWLQSFGWLRDLAAATTRERGARIAETIMRRWLAAHGEQVTEPAWRPSLWGRRILFWTAYAPYILSSQDLVYRSAVLRTLAQGARHLERSAGRAHPGLPRIMAWSGVIAAALLVQGGAARLRAGEAGLKRALAASLHEDGGILSRSPVEQLGLVEGLAQVRACYLAVRAEVPDWLVATLASAADALAVVVLGDEALSSWQGGNMASRRRVLAALEAAGAERRPLSQVQGWGYQRLEAKTSVLVVDAAPPPPPRALNGGCASTLAFEFSDGAHRLIVNCGGVGRARKALPAELVHALRATAAFSTVTIGDRNSTAVHPDGSLGKGVVEVRCASGALEAAGGARAFTASHDGYVRRFGLVHERAWALSADGRTLTGEDRLERVGHRRRDASTFAARFHLAPAVEVTTTADGRGALLRIRGGAVWQFRCRGGELSVEDSLWVDGEARPHESRQLVVSGPVADTGAQISWELSRAG